MRLVSLATILTLTVIAMMLYVVAVDHQTQVRKPCAKGLILHTDGTCVTPDIYGGGK